ncbi:MAG: T9SS type A sorting domain-containing protein, partial [Bacteroidetes bacterium]|nr:T9SS type A sorting domain-containing protein [Bacteroidota bacterium]
ADPNYVAPTNTANGNPGFEYEVVLQTNFNVSVYNVDGSSAPTLITTYPLSTNSLISVALSTDSGNPDYFYDFTVPASAIGSPSSFRMVATTVTSPSSALQGSRSDIYGIDDSAYPNVATAWQTLINSQPTINLTDIGSGGTGVQPACTAAPVLSGPVNTGSNVSVGGTWTRLDASKPSTATITLYKNGSSVGTASASTGGSWSVTVAAVAAGDIFYAKAQATGESSCLQSSSVTAGCTSPPAAPVLTCASSKGISGTIPSGSTILIYQLPTTTASATSIPLTTNITYPTSTSFAYYVSGCSGGTNNVNNGTYMLMRSSGGCLSSPGFDCISSGSSALTGLATNSIALTTPIYPYQTSISGTGSASGNILRLFINGQPVSTITATGTSFSFTGLTLNASDQIKIYLYSGTACMTVSNAFTVSCYTQPPVISTNTNGKLLSTATAISGTSVYAGATVTLYKGTAPSGVATGSPATTASNGSWTVSGLTLAASDNYYATLTYGGCSSPASAGAQVLAPTTVCPTITGSYTETSTSVTGTLPLSFTGTVKLYLDGVAIGSASVSAATTWTINSPFTYSLYPGGVLSVTAQATGNAENFSCPSTATIGCTSPSTPVVSPLSSSITTGQTVTYNVSNITSGAWYGLLDNNGSSYATSVYKTSTTAFNMTTQSFTTPGTYTLKLSADKLSGCPSAVQSATVTVSASLPVTLVQFGAVYRNGAAELDWSTSSEQQTDHFEIEKSFDGSRFIVIGSVAAAGNSQTLRSYHYTDAAPGNAVVYYRLKEKDIDGSISYSKVAIIHINASLLRAASPNPFDNDVSVQIELDRKQDITARLLDITGRQVYVHTATGNKGINTVQMQGLGSLTTGIYTLVIETGNDTFRQKLMKNRSK